MILIGSVITGTAAAGHAAPVVPPVSTEVAPTGVAANQAGTSDPIRPLICSGHAIEHGNWANIDPNASGIARIELRDCQPVTICNGGACQIVHDAGWIMRVFGKCSPVNCDWGWSKSEFRLSSGHIYGSYDHGHAERYVYAKMSQYRPGHLWVYWRTDFVDSNRPDYEMQEWFSRV
ncbi:hypothetical protein ACFWN2_08605 [Lentzea sp. NPDC058436]|uniref:hypothetical protein n=1 Tax=Lentzea sp. NPDC058436 TaxID=3346499 RepID=UPI00365F141C